MMFTNGRGGKTDKETDKFGQTLTPQLVSYSLNIFLTSMRHRNIKAFLVYFLKRKLFLGESRCSEAILTLRHAKLRHEAIVPTSAQK